MKIDKIIIRGALFSGASFILSIYEAWTQAAPRYGLIFGYILVFAYGIIIILTRKKRPDYQESGIQADE